jgi:spoIIIJ-associated protein
MAKTKKQKAKQNVCDILQEHCEKLLDLMGVKAKTKVTEDVENDSFLVNIDSDEEKGLLIGKRGETINSLQYVLELMLRQALGEWKRVVVNIGNWREKQDEYLGNLAKQAVERVKETNSPQRLYNLSPSQRRSIHLVIQKTEGVVSESEGEGKERCLVVKLDDTK